MIQRTRRRRLTSTAIANVAALCGPPDPGASGQPGSARRPALARATALELARTLAGDRPATAAATERIRRQEAQRGKLFFSDLLDAVCHHRFAPEEAERI